MKEKETPYNLNSTRINKKRLMSKTPYDLDDDIPVVKDFRSLEEIETRLGHGFWGNMSSGYIYDKDNKE